MELFTASTPNGHKVSIMLEECGLAYTTRHIRLGDLEQKEPWFLEINPNGRIPALIDQEAGDLVIFESGAILLYLAEKTGKFLPADVKGRYEVIQWLMFQMSGVGPMQGQAHVFLRYAPERIPFAIERYQKETLRLYGVLDRQLADHEFLAGNLSIADFATFPWVRSYKWAGLEIEQLPHLQRWLAQMAARPGVIRGLDVPEKQADISARKAEETAKVGSKLI